MALLEKQTQDTYSIVEARNHFATLIHHAEAVQQPVRVTRRGEIVAVILSIDEYERLTAAQSDIDIVAVYQRWREQHAVDTWVDNDPFADVRDQTPLSAEPTWV